MIRKVWEWVHYSYGASSRRRDAFARDLTHKEVLPPDAPVATVGKICADWFIATIVIVVWDVEHVEITIVDQIAVGMRCKEV
jgi:hypothetical protein